MITLIFLSAGAAYIIGRALYLLYLSPLAKFPGSPWAALSEYWEAWYNIGFAPGKRGQTLFILEKMHRDPKYGTAIRMGPNEIHIYDPKFYHQLYSLNTAFYKDPAVHKVLGAPSSTVAETDPVKHKRRRRPLESLFSRQSILELEPMVMSKIEFCCQRFDEIESNGRLIKVEGALKSLTIDIVSHFGLGRSLGALEHEDFWSSHVQVFQTYLHSIHIIKAFPFVRTLSVGLPLWLARRLSGTVAMGKELEILARRYVDDFITAYTSGAKPTFPTVMERLLTALPSKGFTVPTREGLRDEVLTLISAGNDTTSLTTMTGLFQILRNPQIHTRLLAELKAAIPSPTGTGSFLQLEKLPYLSAVIKESLRYTSAAASRTPRLVPPGGVTLPDGRHIPAGTRVGMAIYHVHYNEDLFPDARSFVPERWIMEESGHDEETMKRMQRFFVPFSKGTRSCLGVNLAYMELYLIMAHLVRRFDFATDTTDEDMRWDDMIVAKFWGDFLVRAKRRAD